MLAARVEIWCTCRDRAVGPLPRISVMLGVIVTLLVVALIAGVLGFGGLAGAAIEISKIVFAVAIVLFLVSVLISLVRGRTAVRRKHPVN